MKECAKELSVRRRTQKTDEKLDVLAKTAK
jgi:hypothetical protein